jgi:hypothetical protein
MISLSKYRHIIILSAIALTGLTVALLLLLYFGPGQTLTVTDIKHEYGSCYIATLPHDGWSEERGSSGARLFENGTPLLRGGALHDEIRKDGHGLYSFWKNAIYFSSSDGSDPSQNGRVYTARGPSSNKLLRVAGTSALLASILVWLVVLYYYRTDLRQIVISIVNAGYGTRVALVLLLSSWAILLSAWIITRLPFFINFPVVGFNPDYESYFNVLSQIQSGRWPLFNTRTPGYPLFLFVVFTFFKSNFAVTIVQTFLSLASALFLVWTAYRLKPFLALPSALAMAGFISLGGHLENDFNLLTESLYTTCLVFMAGFLFLGVSQKRKSAWAACSFFLAYAIYTRPAGLFLVFIWLLIIIYMVITRHNKGALIAFSSPFILMLLGLSLYNKITGDFFGLSAFGEQNLASATSFYWREDPRYSPALNETIREIQSNMSDDERRTLRDSWNPVQLHKIYSKYYDSNYYGIFSKYLKKVSMEEYHTLWISRPDVYNKLRSIMRMLILDSIERSPQSYIKFFLTEMIYFLWLDIENQSHESFYVTWMPERYKKMVIEKNYQYPENIKASLLKEYVNPVRLPYFIEENTAYGTKISVRETLPLKTEKNYQRIAKLILLNHIWAIFGIIVYVNAAIRLFKSRGHDHLAFICFILLNITLGQAILVSLSQTSLVRYVVPVMFCRYLAVAFYPAMLLRQPGITGG